MDAAIELIEATGAKLSWEEKPAGTAAIERFGAPLPQETINSISKNGIAFKGPLMTPVGGGFRSVNVALRQELDLYANVRPATTLQGVTSKFEDVNLVVIRENTQGLYSGIEYHVDPQQQAAHAISIISRYASERVIRFAFEYARSQQRRKVTLVHKANILKLTTGLFLRVGRELAAQYPDIEFNDRIIDNMAMQLVLNPAQFDVIVTTNLFGDILSDLVSGLIGGLGVAPSGNYGEEVAIFEAIHGTAPDIAGQAKANPTAVTLSGALLLRHIGCPQESVALETALRHVIKEGQHVTPDLGGSASTQSFCLAVKEVLRAGG
ncbi:MAG: NAD-dependent isocitrate dehydrogenase [Myxococcales bacterium]|nr:NAD-dependent isocitrate dehydrogenase [Myxococcales bacterium]